MSTLEDAVRDLATAGVGLQKEVRRRVRWLIVAVMMVAMLAAGFITSALVETARLARLQTEQTAFSQARAPQTRLALCNLEMVLLQSVDPRKLPPAQQRIVTLLRQNQAALRCSATVQPLPSNVPTAVPTG